MVSNRSRRRAWTVEGFQAQLVLTLVVWLGVWLLLFAALLLGPLVIRMTMGEPADLAPGEAALLSFLHGRLWAPLAVLFAGITLLFARETHRVAGPLYRFRQVFGQVARGDVSMTVKIRAGDYLVQECEDLDQMVASLRSRLRRVQAATTQLRGGLEKLAQEVGPSQLPLVASLLAHSHDADDAAGRFVTFREEEAGAQEKVSIQHIRTEAPRSDSGFSLVELLMACSILSTLVALAVPAYQSALDSSRVAKAIGDVNAIGKDVEMYRVGVSCYPSSLKDIGRDVLRDPWGNPYRFAVPQKPGGKGKAKDTGSCQACGGACVGTGAARKDKNLVPVNGDFDLYSMGKDGLTAAPLTARESQDDIVRGRNGGFVGLVRDY